MWGQRVLEGPDEDRAHRCLAEGLDLVGEGQILTARACEHVGRVGHPLHPLDALALGEGHVMEIAVLLHVGVRLRDSTCLLLPEVSELLLEDVDRLVRLKCFLHAHTHIGKELRELVDLVVAQVSTTLQKVIRGVLCGLVHRPEPDRLASASPRLLDGLDPYFELLPLQGEIWVLLRSAILRVLAGVTELACLAKVSPRLRDHYLHQRP
mmetsp:Transcript_1325/g.2879  ORF Transcript_1325/g.2879 Transcript_1325/m.2879 type:complete len:209 (-) Transcript_1325:156-782(-)